MNSRYCAARDAAIEASMKSAHLRKSQKPHHCRVGKVRRKASPSRIVARMADVLIERASLTGGAGEQALRDANFSVSEIAAYGEQAAEHARALQTS